MAQVCAAYLVETSQACDGQLHGDRQVVLEATHLARVGLAYFSKHGFRGLGDDRVAAKLVADGLARLVHGHLRREEVVAEEDVAHAQGVAKLKAANRVGCQIVIESNRIMHAG